MPWLINSAQLEKFRKSQKSLIILDASIHLPSENRDAKKEFLEKHIVDAQFFDIDEFSDPNPNAPHSHMLLRDEDVIAQKLGALGIRNDYKIIFYDNSKLRSSCRALWMMKVFGHNPQLLYILDGGFNAWNHQSGKTESGKSTPAAKTYTVKFQPHLIRTLSEMKTNFHYPKEQVVDLRHALRFAGGPESQPHLRQGHIPGSFSFPYTSFFDHDHFFRPLDKIRQLLAGVGIDLNTPIITTCGSAITAPILNFVLDLLGNTQHAVYNGSWSEWATNKLYEHELSLDERPVRSSLDS